MLQSATFAMLTLALGVFTFGCQSTTHDGPRLVEAACGQCLFDLPGDSCDLAVRLDGTAYFVDGTGIDDHGDAHADDGLCNAVRPAHVEGEVIDGRFVATSFKLVPEEG